MKLRFLFILPSFLLISLTWAGAAMAVDFTVVERANILSLGPWPPAAEIDPSNRASGKPEAIAFGKILFSDRRLSKSLVRSCADCHQPDKAFADNVSLPKGYGEISRHTPAITNMRWRHWFGWGGEADSLWAQTIRPMLSRKEMSMTPGRVKRLVRDDPELACHFKASFGLDPEDLDKKAIVVLVAKALAAYQETLVTQPTAFDHFRDALAANDAKGQAAYPAAAKRGLKIFAGEGRCTFCHAGPMLSNGEFGNIGVPHFIAKGKVDQGRFGGIRALNKSRYNLLSSYNDDATGNNALRTRHVKQQHRNWGEFKVPSLRNVADTPPYMHNGSIATLEKVVEFYADLNEEQLHSEGEKILRPLNLDSRGKADLLAFLQSLSASVTDRMYSSPEQHPCLSNK